MFSEMFSECAACRAVASVVAKACIYCGCATLVAHKADALAHPPAIVEVHGENPPPADPPRITSVDASGNGGVLSEDYGFVGGNPVPHWRGLHPSQMYSVIAPPEEF